MSVIIPLSLSSIAPFSPFSPTDTDTSQYSPSINITYTKPSLGLYKDLNKDPNVHDMVSKYVYYKLIDKWLYKDLSEMLNYFNISGNKVSIISSMSKYNRNKEHNATDKKKIISHLEKILSIDDMYDAITEFRMEVDINWYDIPKNDYITKKFLKSYLKKMFRDMINK